MDEEKITEQSKEDEIAELKRQLEAAKAENQRLENEMKYKDKQTGLWNRKYAENTLAEIDFAGGRQDFTVVCADIENIAEVIEKGGVDAGDALIKNIADELQLNFGSNAVCCKLAGNKMCVFLDVPKAQLDLKVKGLDSLIMTIKASYSQVDIFYGIARHADHMDKDAAGLLSEAEYAMQMTKVSMQKISQVQPAVKKVRNPGDPITILMIDDSLIILRTLQMMLKDQYKVLMTTSGMEGYEIAKNKQPDMILLDYNMPVVDGERVLYLLKESNITRDIPVVFISGVTDKEKILKVASLKPAGYLLKPVQKDNLLNVVSSVLQSKMNCTVM